MPNFCAAYGCSNNSSKSECIEKRISFHRFPFKNSTLLKQWKSRINRINFNPTEYSRLCSEHFEKECYESCEKRTLKVDAVPTIFTFVKEKKKRKRTSYEFGSVSNSLTDGNDVGPTSVDEAIQTDDDVIAALLKINTELEDAVKKLNDNVKKLSLKPDTISDHHCLSITGFDKETFNCIYDFLNLETEPLLNAQCTEVKEQFFIYLIKMKTGITDDFLSAATGITQCSISRYMKKMSSVIYRKLKVVNLWQSKSQIKEFMPERFKISYPDVVVIIDTTEFKIQKPSSPTFQQLTFSSYKNCNTLKGLIGIAPSGALMFISDLWGGSISDKELFLKSGILDHLNPGEAVMADKGFTVKNELAAKHCKLVQPIFMNDKIQFTVEEKAISSKVSRLRVHVERAIGRMKNFKYFSSLHNQSLHNVNENFYNVSFLSMFKETLISF